MKPGRPRAEPQPIKTNRRFKPMTYEELEADWRADEGGPNFIGPVAPPMLLWLYRHSPKSPWELEAKNRRRIECLGG
jgi:hypothetical protein